MKYCGITIGTYARELRFTNIDICYNDGIGLNVVGGSDNFYQFLTLRYNGLGGFYLGGSASRVISCKAFNNGFGLLNGGVNESYGFNVTGLAQTLVACEAQENGGHGFVINSLKDSSLSDLRADRNGMYDNTLETKTFNYSGIYLKGSCANITLTGTCNDYKKSQGGEVTQGYGVICEALAQSYINIMIKNNANLYRFDQNYVLSNGVNQININGKMISRMYGKSLTLSNDDVDGVAYVDLGEKNDETKWRIYREVSGNLRIDRYDNGAWGAAPLILTKDGSVKIGTSTGKLGFFGAWGATKKTCKDDATDLNSALILVNQLKAILKAYGMVN